MKLARTQPLIPLGALLLSSSPVFAQIALQPVEIREKGGRYQEPVAATVKSNAAPKDVPQSLTIVNDKLMHDQGTDTFKGALRNVPGITFEAGEGGRIGDSIRLRGFSVSGDIYLDGIRDIAQYNRDTFNDDRIEVLRGSSSTLFGRGSTGGVVNQVSKAPRLSDRTVIDATVGDGNYARVAADYNIRSS